MDYIIDPDLPLEYIPQIEIAMTSLMNAYVLSVEGSNKPLKVDMSRLVGTTRDPDTEELVSRVIEIYIEPQYNHSFLHKLDIGGLMPTPSLSIFPKKDVEKPVLLRSGGSEATALTLDRIMYTLHHHPSK